MVAERVEDLDAEDAKLVTLARSARVRTGGDEGAAVRDDMGRTYAAGAVSLPSLRLTALQAACAAALSSGSDRLESAVVCTDANDLAAEDDALRTDLGVATVHLVTRDGSLTATR